MHYAQGKSVRLHLVEGTPQGLLTAEIINWTGHVITGPRSKLPQLLLRGETDKAGVYMLTGQDPDDFGKQFVYIGQSENIRRRLVQHNRDAKKAFWEQSCIVTSKDSNLTSGHIKYLESRLISIAQSSGLITITNDTRPEPSNLPEADIADMEFFLSQLRLMLPLVGFEFVREPVLLKERVTAEIETARPASASISPTFEINSQKLHLTATAREIDGEFVVLAGSLCRSRWEGVESHHYYNLWQSLYLQGKIGPDNNGSFIFKDNVPFTSPSPAAAVIYGRAANGRTAWRVAGTSQTYDEWQNASLPGSNQDDG